MYTVHGYRTPKLLYKQSVRDKMSGRTVGGKFVTGLNWKGQQFDLCRMVIRGPKIFSKNLEAVSNFQEPER